MKNDFPTSFNALTMFPNKMIANQGQCGTHNHSNMFFLQWYNALHTSQRSLWEVELRDDPKETTKRTSAYWLDINSLRRSNGRLARMDRNRKCTCFQYLETIQIKPLQAILENNILWTKKHTQTNKVARAGYMITAVTMRSNIFWLSFSLKLHWIIYHYHIIN